MADMYLYNGIELPELPDGTVWDRETHPFAYVTEIPADHVMNLLGFSFFMLVVAQKTAIYDGSWVNIGTDENHNEMKMFVTPKKGVDSGDYEAIRGTWMYYDTMYFWPQFATLDTLTWTNTDIKYGGRVVYKATEPVPVGASTLDTTVLLMGWRVGQLIRGLRSGGVRPLYNVSFVNGILYISNAPAKLEGNILNLKAAAVTDAGGE